MEATLSKVTSKDGTPIAYWRSGTGPALVLVHGTTADHTRWKSILPELEQHFTVYAIDRRGRGQSGDAPTFALEMEFEDVAAVVSAIPGPAYLLGHSYGALCALEAALRVTNLRKLVLYEPAFPVEGVPLYTSEARERMEALLAAGDRQALLVAFFQGIVQMSPSEIAILQADPSWAARVAGAHTLVRELAEGDYAFSPQRFQGLTTPTLLLTGGDSPPFLTAPTRALAVALPNSRVTVMPGQGHVAMTTAPNLFLREVISFLEE